LLDHQLAYSHEQNKSKQLKTKPQGMKQTIKHHREGGWARRQMKGMSFNIARSNIGNLLLEDVGHRLGHLTGWIIGCCHLLHG